MGLVSTLRSGLRSGLILGVVALFMALIGMLQAFSGRMLVGDLTLTTVLLVGFGLGAGLFGVRQLGVAEERIGHKILAGVVSGLVCGLLLALLLVFVTYTDARDVLVNVTPELAAILSFGHGVGIGSLILVVLFVVSALLAVLVGLLPGQVRRPIIQGVAAVLLMGLFWEVLTGLDISRAFLNATGLKAGKVLSPPAAVVVFIVVALITYFWPRIQLLRSRGSAAVSPARRNLTRWVSIGLVIVALMVLPQAVGLYWSQTLTTIGLFVLMGLGLNIVVGLAGLLDLGYVAFYAIGAYTMALFSSPASSLGLGWSFWVVLPLALAVAAFSGILLGIPVLRLRGDYLAIVTLGFGEIIRLLAQSDLLKPYIGGPQGILETPAPSFFGVGLDDPRYLYYLILLACIVGVFLSTRLDDSRIGRAWTAMREDEDVAQAMGINLVVSKLLAFSIGAAFAGVAGAIFASRQGAIFPADFTLFISINVLCLIIIGGIGSIPGTVVGAFFLIGLPEVLREVDEFRILAYGAGLVIMMIVKPEGLLPSARRRLELHEAEMDDAPVATPGVAET